MDRKYLNLNIARLTLKHLSGPSDRNSAKRPITLVFFLITLFASTSIFAEESITDIKIIHGGSKNISCPAGYTKINKDLNKGVGGDFIYLCYESGGRGLPITNLFVEYSHRKMSSDDYFDFDWRFDYWPQLEPMKYYPFDNNSRWEICAVDLNRGAGGRFIYLHYTKDPDCTPITDIEVTIGNHKSILCPVGYRKLDWGEDYTSGDLNKGAGGPFIFLCYKGGGLDYGTANADMFSNINE